MTTRSPRSLIEFPRVRAIIEKNHCPAEIHDSIGITR